MLVKPTAVRCSLCWGTEVRRQNKRGFAICDSDSNYCRGSQPSFTLAGTRIYLQQRFAFVPSSQETKSHVRCQNKTYSCFADEVLEERKTKTKTDTKRISGGVRRTSIHRRLKKQNPSNEVVYKKRTKSKNRSVSIRQPLVMCTMNLPGKHVPQEKATQMFPSTEEAKQMLRFLASTNHECTRMMAESVSADDARQRQENRTELLDKPDYLEDTYDYLFHRHVQTLNGVIQRQEQQEADAARGIYQQKHSKQVIQLCCGDGRDCDDTSIIIDSTGLSSRHNSSTVSQNPPICRATGSNSLDSDKNDINTSDFCARQTSCNENKNKEMKGRCKKGELTRMSADNQLESCHDTQKSGTTHRKNSDGSVNINIVTNKINALELQDVRVPQKPVITFNHVSETNECSSSFSESESLNLKLTKTTSVSSTLRSSSSSPLLEVPVSLEDLTSEMMRPPIN